MTLGPEEPGQVDELPNHIVDQLGMVELVLRPDEVVAHPRERQQVDPRRVPHRDLQLRRQQRDGQLPRRQGHEDGVARVRLLQVRHERTPVGGGGLLVVLGLARHGVLVGHEGAEHVELDQLEQVVRRDAGRVRLDDGRAPRADAHAHVNGVVREWAEDGRRRRSHPRSRRLVIVGGVRPGLADDELLLLLLLRGLAVAVV